ncbi:hypothetical protein D3C78_1468450 [compost metagenome]
MVAYYSTSDLCERFRCSSRTLFRRMKRAVNPFPQPCLRHVGSCNLWDAEEVFCWEQREKALCCRVALGAAIPPVLPESVAGYI